VAGWARWAIAKGLEACQKLLPSSQERFRFGGAPTLADVCLVPQLFNARRFGVDLGPSNDSVRRKPPPKRFLLSSLRRRIVDWTLNRI
jgi:glutathione S-transferase